MAPALHFMLSTLAHLASSTFVAQDRHATRPYVFARSATLRAELVDGERYFNLAEAKASIAVYIERFYNIERMHSCLGYMSPIEFELRNQLMQTAA